MLFRICLPFLYITLYLLSSCHADAPDASNGGKKRIEIVNFSWGNCGSAADSFLVKSFGLGPDPLHIPGNITASIAFSFANPSPTDITMLVVMQKYIAGFWIKVPCTKNVGSCTYQNICPGWSEVCTALFAQYGVPCKCPIPVGTFTIPDTTVEATQTIPSEAIGTFRVYADLLSNSAGQLGCLEFQISITN